MPLFASLLEWVPPKSEPFYQPTGNEFAPEIVGENSGTVVYFIEPGIGIYGVIIHCYKDALLVSGWEQCRLSTVKAKQNLNFEIIYVHLSECIYTSTNIKFACSFKLTAW